MGNRRSKPPGRGPNLFIPELFRERGHLANVTFDCENPAMADRSSPQAIREQVASLNAQAEQAGARGDFATADRLIGQANGLIERHESITGLSIDLTGAVLPPTFKGNVELNDTEKLIAAGVDPSNLTLAEQANKVAEIEVAQSKAQDAERQAVVNEHIGAALGVDTSRLTPAEVTDLAAANPDRLEQAALSDVGLPPPEVVTGPGGERVIVDPAADVRDFLATPIATVIPPTLQDKVSAPGSAVAGPEAGSIAPTPTIVGAPGAPDLLEHSAGGARVGTQTAAGDGATRLPTSPSDTSRPGPGSTSNPTGPGTSPDSTAGGGGTGATTAPPGGEDPSDNVDAGFEDPASDDTGGGTQMTDIGLWFGADPSDPDQLTGNFIDGAGNLFYEDGTPMSPDDVQYKVWQAAAEREGTTLEQMGQDLNGRPGPDAIDDAPPRPDHIADQLDAFADQHSLIRAVARDGATTIPAPDVGGELESSAGPRLDDGDDIPGFDPIVDPGADREAPGSVPDITLGPEDGGDIDPPDGHGEEPGGSNPFDPGIVAAEASHEPAPMLVSESDLAGLRGVDPGGDDSLDEL